MAHSFKDISDMIQQLVNTEEFGNLHAKIMTRAVVLGGYATLLDIQKESLKRDFRNDVKQMIADQFHVQVLDEQLEPFVEAFFQVSNWRNQQDHEK